jgi:hypothetical protein
MQKKQFAFAKPSVKLALMNVTSMKLNIAKSAPKLVGPVRKPANSS